MQNILMVGNAELSTLIPTMMTGLVENKNSVRKCFQDANRVLSLEARWPND